MVVFLMCFLHHIVRKTNVPDPGFRGMSRHSTVDSPGTATTVYDLFCECWQGKVAVRMGV
jgi:hypothetical protein